MPYYLFRNEETKEVVEVFFHMNDEKKYVDDSGIEWKRIFTVPQATIATRINPFSQAEFVRATENKTDTLGDLWDRSKEMSERRAEKAGGVDPVKEKFFNDYSQKRKGALHPDAKPKTFENEHIKVEL